MDSAAPGAMLRTNDEDLLATVSELFVTSLGNWPTLRELALRLGESESDVEPRIDMLMRGGSVGYDCKGADRFVMVLLRPDQVDWHKDDDTKAALAMWLSRVSPRFATQVTAFADEPHRFGDYYAAYLMSHQRRRSAAA
jgi:hypothetical protein